MIERIVAVTSSDAMQRATRLVEIASAVGRGTVAQRHQRVRAAMTNRATPRDEVAFYTLIAHRADDRDRAYLAFVETWRQMEASEFPLRLRRCVGLEPAAPPAPMEASSAAESETDVGVEAAVVP
jgi:hypothetical protein